MATTHQDTNVNQLVINKMTKQEYDNLSQVSETELYLVEEQVDSVVTQNSTNPVQSGAVYEAIQDIGGTINDGTTTFTKNNETIGTTSANQSVNQTIALPNDVVMCNLIDNKALASYATPITRFKYIEDHGWVDMDRSNIQYNEGTGEWTGTFVSLDITEGEYYYDMDNDTVFVADENSEMQDVTSTVIIQGDANKLYCDTTTNMLYRYDGTDFIALTSNFSGDYNDLINKPDLNFLKQRDLTTYQGENDEIVQHVGSNSSGYINGYVYKKSNVHSLTYNSVTYTYVGETDGNVTWKLYKITQDNIDYVVPQGVTIGDNFWVVRDFTDLEVVHIFEIDDIGENEEGTRIDIKGHFLGTNITLHFVAPYSEIINTSKALIYKNGNNYLYCDSTFKFFASSVNNNNANVIPFDGTINNDYIYQRINVQPQQLSLESNKVKYTLPNETKLTLAQESSLANIAFSGSYKDLIIKPSAFAFANGNSSAKYYKVATFENNNDILTHLTLFVSSFFAPNVFGFVNITVRWRLQDTIPSDFFIKWLTSVNVDNSQYIITRKRNNGVSMISLYIRAINWESIHITRIAEHGWTSEETHWNFINTSGVDTIPSDEIQQVSTNW